MQEGEHLSILTQRLTDPSSNLLSEERLAEMLVRQEAQESQLQELAGEIKRLSRALFKQSTLAEAQDQKVATALETLREIVGRREQVGAERALRNQQEQVALRTAARGEMVADLLPVLDGIEAALSSGRALLERRQNPWQGTVTHVAAPRPAGLWDQFRHAFGLDLPARPPNEEVMEEEVALLGWLEGLELVRERFLALLDSEGIEPVASTDEIFDPRLHVVVEAVLRDDLHPGTVISVPRQGYRQQERVLRYAEVVVAKATPVAVVGQ